MIKHEIRKMETEKAEPILEFWLEQSGDNEIYLKVRERAGDTYNLMNINSNGTLHLSSHVSVEGIVTEGEYRKIKIV